MLLCEAFDLVIHVDVDVEVGGESIFPAAESLSHPLRQLPSGKHETCFVLVEIKCEI